MIYIYILYLQHFSDYTVYTPSFGKPICFNVKKTGGFDILSAGLNPLRGGAFRAGSTGVQSVLVVDGNQKSGNKTS